MVIHSARWIVESPAKSFGPAAFAAVVGKYGARVGSTPEEEYPHLWINAFQLEYRWQVATTLALSLRPGERDIVSDLDSFLNAIDADPTDDMLWRVFADWLEERGDPASGPIRQAVEQGDWDGCRDFLFLSLDRPRRLLADCDCVERVLPLFEAVYPEDPSPRRLLETLRRKGPDARVKRR